MYPPECLWAVITCSGFLCRSDKLIEIPHTTLELYAEIIHFSAQLSQIQQRFPSRNCFGELQKRCCYAGSSLDVQ